MRLAAYDYSSNGYYFVTICAKDKQTFRESKLLIEEAFYSLPGKFSGLTLDYSVFMDNHMHAILVLESSTKPLGEIIRQFKAIVTMKVKRRDIWQKGYYEHVIRTEKALYNIREYIQNNPLAEKLKFEQFY